jgi:hypothetical protein
MTPDPRASIPPPKPQKVKEKDPGKGKEKPFQELRFTRSRQAVTFSTAGAVFLAIFIWLGVLLWWRVSVWTQWLWLLLPALAAAGCFRLAVHLTRHAFLLLSPIGIEIFPFFRPAQQMQLFSWGEIAHAEVTEGDRLLILTLAGYSDSKVIIGLDPIPKRTLPLLRRAVEGVMERRGQAAAAGTAPDSAASV